MNKKTLTIILISLAIADLLGAIDATGVNIALPKITSDLSIPISISQWIPNAYTLVLVSTLIFMGKIGDKIGAKKLYLAGLVLFGLASLVLGFTNNPTALIATRSVQGLGTAILYTMPMSIIAHLWKEREKAFAVTAAFFAGGMFIGPVVGGLLTSIDLPNYHGWHLIFLLNVPFIIIGFYIANKYIPKIETSTEEKLDYLSILLLFGGLTFIVLSLTIISKFFILLGLVFLFMLYLYELKVKKPLLDFSLFKNQTFAFANFVSFFSMVTMIGMGFVLTFYLQDILKWSPIQTGIAFLPIPIVTAIFASIGSKVKNWRLGAITTTILTFSGISLLTLTNPETSFFKIVLPGIILISAGSGLLMTVIFAAILGSAPTERSGNVSGILNTLQQIGSMIGIALVANIVLQYKLSFEILTIIALAGFICALFVKKHENFQKI